MKVHELIERLKTLPQDNYVVAAMGETLDGGPFQEVLNVTQRRLFIAREPENTSAKEVRVFSSDAFSIRDEIVEVVVL